MPLNIHISENIANTEPILNIPVGEIYRLFNHIMKYSTKWIFRGERYGFCYIEESEMKGFLTTFSYEGITSEVEKRVIEESFEKFENSRSLYIRLKLEDKKSKN